MASVVKRAVAGAGVRDRVSAAEWDARVDLAALYRFIALKNWDDHIYTHITVRVPGEDHLMLANPLGFRFNEITASSLLKIDMDGNTVLDGDYPPNQAVAVIHGGVYENIPEARCVVHLHTIAGTAVSMQKHGLLPLSQKALILGGIAYHDFEGVAVDKDECERLARNFGDAQVMILRNHGTLTWGRSVHEAFALTYQLESACEYQIAAMSGGAELNYPAPEVVEKTKAFGQGGANRQIALLSWQSVLREVERQDPGFRE